MAAPSSAPAKRAASSSVSPSKRVAKSAKVDVTSATTGSTSKGKLKRQDTDDFDDDVDADALLEAAAQAEEELEQTRASQSSQPSVKSIKPSSQASSKGATPSAPAQSSQSTAVSIAPAAKGDGLFALPPDAHLLKHHDPTLEHQTMDPEWYGRLESEIKAPYFADLKAYLGGELAAGKQIFPPAHLVHSWSRLTPLRNVKVVVVGQDPYHGPGQACGHSFSVPKGVSVPGSLQNIYKELSQEYGASFKKPSHGCLDAWAKQGVLLLNACLTVTAHQAGSHHGKGWEKFTQQILRAVASDAAHGQKPSVKTSTIASMFSKAAPASQEDKKQPNGSAGAKDDKHSASKGVVFLAWGLPAQKTLAAAGITDKSSNVLLLKSPHPSPLSAHRGFLGNNHFKQANDWLESPARYGAGAGIQWGAL